MVTSPSRWNMLLKYLGGQADGREMEVPDGVSTQIIPHPAGRLGKITADEYRREKQRGAPDVMAFVRELSREEMERS
jgi:hypothetical protein